MHVKDAIATVLGLSIMVFITAQWSEKKSIKKRFKAIPALSLASTNKDEYINIVTLVYFLIDSQKLRLITN